MKYCCASKHKTSNLVCTCFRWQFAKPLNVTCRIPKHCTLRQPTASAFSVTYDNLLRSSKVWHELPAASKPTGRETPIIGNIPHLEIMEIIRDELQNVPIIHCLIILNTFLIEKIQICLTPGEGFKGDASQPRCYGAKHSSLSRLSRKTQPLGSKQTANSMPFMTFGGPGGSLGFWEGGHI